MLAAKEMNIQVGYFFCMVYCLVCLLFSTGCDKAEYPDCIDGSQAEGESHGCGNIFVYRYEAGGALTVSLDAWTLGLAKECRTFDLSKYTDGVEVSYLESGDDPDLKYLDLCVESQSPNYVGPVQVWNAYKGSLSVSISTDHFGPECSHRYRASVQIDDLELSAEDTTETMIYSSVFFGDVDVGWCPD